MRTPLASGLESRGPTGDALSQSHTGSERPHSGCQKSVPLTTGTYGIPARAESVIRSCVAGCSQSTNHRRQDGATRALHYSPGLLRRLQLRRRGVCCRYGVLQPGGVLQGGARGAERWLSVGKMGVAPREDVQVVGRVPFPTSRTPSVTANVTQRFLACSLSLSLSLSLHACKHVCVGARAYASQCSAVAHHGAP